MIPREHWITTALCVAIIVIAATYAVALVREIAL